MDGAIVLKSAGGELKLHQKESIQEAQEAKTGEEEWGRGSGEICPGNLSLSQFSLSSCTGGAYPRPKTFIFICTIQGRLD